MRCMYFDTETHESLMFVIGNRINDIQIEYNVYYFCSKKHHKNMRKDYDKRNQYCIWRMDGDKRIEILKELYGKQQYLNYLKEL